MVWWTSFLKKVLKPDYVSQELLESSEAVESLLHENSWTVPAFFQYQKEDKRNVSPVYKFTRKISKGNQQKSVC